MLVIWLFLLSAIFSANNATESESTDAGHIRSADYNRLLDLLYRRYKSYKREHQEQDVFSSSKIYKRHIGHSAAFKRAALKKVIQSLIQDVATEEVSVERKALKDRNSVKGEKRDTVVQLHSVTPIHDDDVTKEEVKEDTASKRGFIIPVHDDDAPANVAAAASAAAAAMASETATLKNIVPVHDDDDVGINSNGYRFGDRNRELGDDMKTFITVVEKNKLSDEPQEVEHEKDGLEGMEGFHDDNVEQHGYGMFDMQTLKRFNTKPDNIMEALHSEEPVSTKTKESTETSKSIVEVKMPEVSPKQVR